MQILPHNMWQQFQSSFNNKHDFVTFLAQITLQSNSLQKLQDEVTTINKPISNIINKYKKSKDDDKTEPEDTIVELSYHGRGIFYQKFVSRDIYIECGNDLFLDLIRNPDIALNYDLLLPIAVWFWNKHNMSKFKGDFDHINEFLENKVYNKQQYQQMYNVYSNFLR